MSQYGLDPSSEFLAGWIDGIQSGRDTLVNAARPELRRFGLWLADDYRVSMPEEGEMPAFDPLREHPRENPLDDETYENGFQSGLRDVQREILRTARADLADHDLFLADDGSVMPTELVSFFVNYYRETTKLHEATEASFDTFVDDLVAEIPRPDETPMGDPDVSPRLNRVVEAAFTKEQQLLTSRRAAKQNAPPPKRGLWTMIRDNMDRRTAVAALTSALFATAGSWFVFKTDDTSKKVESPDSEVTQAYQPPAVWNNVPQSHRGHLILVDQAFHTTEAAGGPTQVSGLVGMVMATPGADGLKEMIAKVICERPRFTYLPLIVLGLNSNSTPDAATRVSLISQLNKLEVLQQGPSPFNSDFKTALLQCHTSGTETNAKVISLTSRLLTQLGVPH
ncbi:MAG: hypothetical protein CMJ83_15575 [Planctomycetes bacterium]|nr:hypothetical protein [Planctomycetota bacterium]